MHGLAAVAGLAVPITSSEELETAAECLAQRRGTSARPRWSGWCYSELTGEAAMNSQIVWRPYFTAYGSGLSAIGSRLLTNGDENPSIAANGTPVSAAPPRRACIYTRCSGLQKSYGYSTPAVAGYSVFVQPFDDRKDHTLDARCMEGRVPQLVK